MTTTPVKKRNPKPRTAQCVQSTKESIKTDDMHLAEIEDALTLTADAVTLRERSFYGEALYKLVDALWHNGKSYLVNRALDFARRTDFEFDLLQGTMNEVAQAKETAQSYAQLQLIPVFAWSHYAIASGTLLNETSRSLAELASRTLATSDIRVKVGNRILTSEEAPATAETLQAMTDLFVEASDCVVNLLNWPSSDFEPNFCDARYIPILFEAPNFEAFNTQRGMDVVNRTRLDMFFCQQAHAVLETDLIGANFAVQPPMAFQSGATLIEDAFRLFSCRALIAHTESYGISRDNIIVTIAQFSRPSESEDDPVDLRISTALLDNPERLISGNAFSVFPEEIEMILESTCGLIKNEGVAEVRVLSQIFPLEYSQETLEMVFPTASGMIDTTHGPEGLDVQPPPTLN